MELFRYVLTDMAAELRRLPPAVIIAGAVYICFLSLYRKSPRYSERQMRRLVFPLLVLYAYVVMEITILSRSPGSRTGVDLRPFSILGGPKANAYVVENILLFIPPGIMQAAAWRGRRRLLLCTLAGLLFSFAIEAVQLLTQRGHFQTDDILANTLGAFLGCFAGGLIFSKVKRPEG